LCSAIRRSAQRRGAALRKRAWDARVFSSFSPFFTHNQGHVMPDTQAALAVDKPTDLQPGPQVALLAMQSSGGTIDVQMGMSQGELDMHTPHGYMLNWLAQNWPALTAAAQISYTKFCQQQGLPDGDSGCLAPDTHIATPKLVDIAGSPLQ
jgi:hypothetical protein